MIQSPLSTLFVRVNAIKKIFRDMPPYISTDHTVKCKTCGGLPKEEIDCRCKTCRGLLKEEIDYKTCTSHDNKGVFVTKTSSFVISDNLYVIPNNPTSILKMLESRGIENFAALKENTIKLGSDEV